MIGQQIGTYRIVRRLGEGGMGEVYEAAHDKLGRRVAIKVLHPHVALAPGLAKRFRNEARAVNIIRHPGVVDIYEHGQLPDGTLYIVMEFLEGRSLRERIEESRAAAQISEPSVVSVAGGGRITPSEVVLVGQQIASALAAAHGKGIVHRVLS